MKRLALILTLILSGFVFGLVLNGRLRSTDESGAATPTPAAAAVPGSRAAAPQAPPAALPVLSVPTPAVDFTTVAGNAINSVANISSIQIVRTANSPFANDPFFGYFFGNDDDYFGTRDRRSQSLGSGVIVSSDGYVVTNSHVVGETLRQPEITVVLPDKREVRATLVGTDPMTDVALLKLEASKLPALPWGDSSQLKVGQWVLAIGSPFQLSQTVTLGIVSAVGRANVGFADYEDFIQTDAAINPGNSGGALVSAAGELVGINTGILSQSGGYQGIGFAIPSNLVRRVIADLIKFGEVRRGSIGYVQVAPMTTQLAAEVGVSGTSGAFVRGMNRASEAFEAGMRPGDVIVSFNGQAVTDAAHFLRLLADARVGSTANLGIMRGGQKIDMKVPVVQSNRSRPRR